MQQDYLLYGFLLLPLYHLFTLVVLVKNLQWMASKVNKPIASVAPTYLISICIPARNEQASIAKCLESIVEASKVFPQTIPIYVLDDHSDDNTAAIITEMMKYFPQIKLLKGQPLPATWRGKNWACHQLSTNVETDFILFLDADVRITKALFQKIYSTFEQYPAVGMLSFWPEQVLNDRYQNVVIPWIYRALLTHLPSVYQHQKPIWMPSYFYRKFKHLFAAANGQCICFRRETYHAIGGHKAVKNEIVEDICLSKTLLSANYSTKILSGKDAISCQMYDTDAQMFEGFRKNFFVGFGKNLTLFIFAGLFHWVMFVLPLMLLFISDYRLIAASSLLIAMVTDFILKQHFNWPKWTVPLHFSGVFWFTVLAYRCVVDHLTNTAASWKGRKL